MFIAGLSMNALIGSPSKKTDPHQKEGLQHLITLAFQQVRNQVTSGIRFARNHTFAKRESSGCRHVFIHRYGAVLVTKGGHVFAAHNRRDVNGGAVVPAERSAVIKAVCEGYTDFKVSA